MKQNICRGTERMYSGRGQTSRKSITAKQERNQTSKMTEWVDENKRIVKSTLRTIFTIKFWIG